MLSWIFWFCFGLGDAEFSVLTICRALFFSVRCHSLGVFYSGRCSLAVYSSDVFRCWLAIFWSDLPISCFFVFWRVLFGALFSFCASSPDLFLSLLGVSDYVPGSATFVVH